MNTDSLTEEALGLFQSLRQPAMGEDGLALCLEAARTKVRLDRLNDILAGKSEHIFEFVDKQGVAEITLRVDPALAEVRQLTTVFRQTVEAIRRMWPDIGEGGGDDDLDL